ncbi:RNA polymerase sigma factor [Flavobacteriaceae bacterium M23B6Z8]
MTHQSDQYYIEQTLKGNKHAYAYILRKYKDMVFSITLKFFKDREEAEDMTQEIFIKVYRALSKYKGEAKFSTWMYRIAYNACLDKTRENKRYQFIQKSENNTHEEGVDQAMVFKDIDQQDKKRIIEAALSTLSSNDQTLIMLYYYEELSLKEISKIMRLQENNIKVRLHRCRVKLADLLKGKEAILKHERL